MAIPHLSATVAMQRGQPERTATTRSDQTAETLDRRYTERPSRAGQYSIEPTSFSWSGGGDQVPGRLTPTTVPQLTAFRRTTDPVLGASIIMPLPT